MYNYEIPHDTYISFLYYIWSIRWAIKDCSKMRKRKRLLNWNKIRFIQTFGTAHQKSRSLGKWTSVQDTRKIDDTGNVLSAIESQGFRNEWASAWDSLKLTQILREMTSGPEGHFTPGSPVARQDERRAGRFCCNRQNLKAMGCKSRFLIRKCSRS